MASGSLLNPDPSGTALPTEIRVLELRDVTALENASFDEVFVPSDTLAAAIVATQTLTLYPDEVASLTLAPSPETRAIVGLAIVREPAGRTWRVIVPIEALPCGTSAQLALHADEYRIERATEQR